MTRSWVWRAGTMLVLAGCESTGPKDPGIAALEAAQARWDSVGPSSYVYAVQRNCFCPIDFVGPARLTVENGVVVESVYVASGLPVSGDAAFPTVDELFERLRSAYEGQAHEITTTYDPELGVPTEAWIDYEELAVDEEFGWLVTEDVVALP